MCVGGRKGGGVEGRDVGGSDKKKKKKERRKRSLRDVFDVQKKCQRDGFFFFFWIVWFGSGSFSIWH